MGRRRGSIRSRGTGKWMVRVYTGLDPETGKRIYHTKTIEGPKRSAERYLSKITRQMDMGDWAEPSGEALGDYLSDWLDTVARTRVSDRTYTDYKGIINRYIHAAITDGMPPLATRRLSDLSSLDIQQLYTALVDDGLSATTVRQLHAVLHSALDQAVTWRMLTHNPAQAVALPKSDKEEMRCLSRDEVERFLAAARAFPADPDLKKRRGHDRTGQRDRWYVLWLVLLATGMRLGEALALRWADLDGDRLRVRRSLVQPRGKGDSHRFKSTKNSKGRPVGLDQDTLKALKTHRAVQAEERLAAGAEYADDDLIFATAKGTPVLSSNLWRRNFKPLAKVIGVPELRIHDLRHTHATLLLSGGIHPKVVQERLGHQSILVTLDLYSHVLPDMQESAVEALEGMFGA